MQEHDIHPSQAPGLDLLSLIQPFKRPPYFCIYYRLFLRFFFFFFFRPGSVIANFSIIFTLPRYDVITPLLEVINKTVGQNELNYLGDMSIQLLDVNAMNGRF